MVWIQFAFCDCVAAWSCHPYSMLNPTWQHWLVYWKKAFYVITIPALTQLDSSSKSFSDVLVIGFILFFLFALWSFICFVSFILSFFPPDFSALSLLNSNITCIDALEGKRQKIRHFKVAVMEHSYALCGVMWVCARNPCWWMKKITLQHQHVCSMSPIK